jgi:arylsulfatase
MCKHKLSAMRPNILFILTDHFRRDSINASETPFLRRLAAEGILFTNAYCASPLCMPSRNAIISGLYPSQTGVCGNQAKPFGEVLRHDTFPARLRQAGYCTAMVGKHHFIDRYGVGLDVVENDQATIEDYGFDHVCQVLDDGENLKNDDVYTRHLKKKGLLETLREKLKGFDDTDMIHPFEDESDTVDGFIRDRAVEYLQAVDASKPFYLNASFVGPHPPYWYPASREKFQSGDMAEGTNDDPAAREKTAFLRSAYRNRCAVLDGYVRDLVDALKQRGLYDNTLIVFSSDHGDMLGDFGIWDKRYFYEASVGVPLIFAGGVVQGDDRDNRGIVDRSLISHLDLYPSFLSLAGAEPAERSPLLGKRAGMDISGRLKDRGGPRRDAVFAELATAVMVRTANWKLVYDAQGGGVQYLFNLSNDPKEQQNLANEPAYDAVALRLISLILDERIITTQYSHIKEEQRLMRARVK